MYTYMRVKYVHSTEHMLYASEIAEIFGLYSVKQYGKHGAAQSNPHARMVKEILEEYAEDHGIDVPELFYNTQRGMAKVYSKGLYYPAMTDFLGKIDIAPNEVNQYTFKNGRRYSFIVNYEGGK